MMLTEGQASSPTEAGFELDVSSHRWAWSAAIFDIIAVSPALAPSTELLLATKHPDDRVVTGRVIAGALTGQGPFRYQSRLVRNDGHIRLVETSGATSFAADGAVRALMGVTSVLSDWVTPPFEEPQTGASSEGELAVALLAHIEEAHSYVYRYYAPIVARASRRVLRHSGQVDDVVQTVFEGLWLHPSRFDPNRGSLAAFLQMRARTCSIDIVRSESAHSSRATRVALCTSQIVDPDDDEVVARASHESLRHILGALPETERTPIELAYFGYMTYRMVASHLGLPEGTVKSRIRSGLSNLRTLASEVPLLRESVG